MIFYTDFLTLCHSRSKMEKHGQRIVGGTGMVSSATNECTNEANHRRHLHRKGQFDILSWYYLFAIHLHGGMMYNTILYVAPSLSMLL